MAGERQKQHGQPVLTPELIEHRTGFRIFASFPEFDSREDVVWELEEEYNRLSSQLGARNVVTSFFVDDNEIRLGLFTREPHAEEGKGVGFGHEGTPIDFMSEDFDR